MKKIEFIPKDELTKNIIDPPKPSYLNIPDWFKKINKNVNKKYDAHRLPDGSSNFTVKKCVPFLDAITSGYTISTPCDIAFVDPKEYNHRVIWDVTYNVISSHGYGQVYGMEIPSDYEKDPWKFELGWGVKTPRGYSCIFMPLMNNFESPFMVFSGVVDTDQYNYPVNIPFVIKNNFFGVIPKGTPIAQIIPFKRDRWKSEISSDHRSLKFSVDTLRSKLEDSYRKLCWSKKEYR